MGPPWDRRVAAGDEARVAHARQRASSHAPGRGGDTAAARSREPHSLLPCYPAALLSPTCAATAGPVGVCKSTSEAADRPVDATRVQVRSLGLGSLLDETCRELLARVELMRAVQPSGGWPEWGEEALLESAGGRRSRGGRAVSV